MSEEQKEESSKKNTTICKTDILGFLGSLTTLIVVLIFSYYVNPKGVQEVCLFWGVVSALSLFVLLFGSSLIIDVLSKTKEKKSMGEEITNTWELAELLEKYAKMLKKSAKLILEDKLDFEIPAEAIYESDPETIKDYGTEAASAETSKKPNLPVGKCYYEAEFRKAKVAEITKAIFKDLKDLKFTPVENNLIQSETFQKYGPDLIVPEPEDIEVNFQPSSPSCLRCKCCKNYFDFDAFDKDGKCPHCHGKTKVGDKIFECDDTEVID